MDPPTWFTAVPASMAVDGRFPTDPADIVASGFWLLDEQSASAPGAAVIAHGTISQGAARATVFAMNPLYRADPEREWAMAGRPCTGPTNGGKGTRVCGGSDGGHVGSTANHAPGVHSQAGPPPGLSPVCRIRAKARQGRRRPARRRSASPRKWNDPSIFAGVS
jgi:hypothetical protein